MIKNDLQVIWSEIHKPEKFMDKVAEDFFDIEFSFLPHKVYQPD